MGLLSMLGLGKATGEAAATAAGGVINALGDAGDKLFTSDAERAQWAVMMKKVEQEPQIIQALTTAFSTASTSRFVSYARSMVMYVLALSMFYSLVVRDVLVLVLRIKPEDMPVLLLDPMVILKFLGGLLGLAG
ncbi:hypothetical protein [Aeromonas salmonicida]|uniref:hypothetical protein n=1 Tax=Aeromonas salmonicida TaxID=645 RepID=UPI00232EC28A|nr:hypothetical protein [Aeromonas salmonicida]WCH25158.1 hypothetical protein ONZ54_23110 [Aeromonas salmonicida]